MKERPILFNGEMVRAIIDGRKTQTRRTVKIQHPLDLPNYYATGRTLCELENQPGAFMEFRHTSQDEVGFTGSPAAFLLRCPYGKPGDRLWVRETFSAMGDKSRQASPIFYRADRPTDNCGWTPSIHMPRWASRILLEVVSVRVERLNEISEDDAKAEGIERIGSGTAWRDYTRPEIYLAKSGESFRSLWEYINGSGSWKDNPWVWVVEFKRIDSVEVKGG